MDLMLGAIRQAAANSPAARRSNVGIVRLGERAPQLKPASV
jgi:hypothetical protein